MTGRVITIELRGTTRQIAYTASNTQPEAFLWWSVDLPHDEALVSADGGEIEAACSLICASVAPIGGRSCYDAVSGSNTAAGGCLKTRCEATSADNSAAGSGPPSVAEWVEVGRRCWRTQRGRDVRAGIEELPPITSAKQACARRTPAGGRIDMVIVERAKTAPSAAVVHC
jgi:hypothetical protein